jgi:hypothetical protein
MKFPSRLRFLLLAPAFVLLSPPQSLRQAADGAGVSIGTAVRPSLFSEAAYASILAREFDVVGHPPQPRQFRFSRGRRSRRLRLHSHGARGRVLWFDKTYQPKRAYDGVLQELAAGRSAK